VPVGVFPAGTSACRLGGMPALLLLVILLVPLLAGCVPSSPRSAGVPTADAPFTLTALDVGQGDATLLRTAQATVLVDTGDPEAGIVRMLRREGVERLDLLVITHPHLDHVGGAPAVLQAMPVDVMWIHPVPDGVTVVPEYQAALREAQLRGIPVRGPPAGAVIAVADLVLEVLGPPPGRPYEWTRSELNNASIVLRASVASAGAVLIAGDVEREAQGDLLVQHRSRLRSDVLVVPHHGSRTSDPEFLIATAASTAVISVGRNNRHGHPAQDILDVLESAGMTVRRTDREGTVRIGLPGTGAG
jgi:competence protein ComEC